jgi:hypothetical protein
MKPLASPLSTSIRYAASPVASPPKNGYMNASYSTLPCALRKAVYSPVGFDGSILFVVRPWRNFGAASPVTEMMVRDGSAVY